MPHVALLLSPPSHTHLFISPTCLTRCAAPSARLQLSSHIAQVRHTASRWGLPAAADSDQSFEEEAGSLGHGEGEGEGGRGRCEAERSCLSESSIEQVKHIAPPLPPTCRQHVVVPLPPPPHLQTQHVVVPLPRHVLHVVLQQGGQPAQPRVAVAPARGPTALDAVGGDPGAQGLEARGERVQLGEGAEITLVPERRGGWGVRV